MDLLHVGYVLVSFPFDEVDLLIKHLHLNEVLTLRQQQIKSVVDRNHAPVMQ